jgi:hypothetical protein
MEWPDAENLLSGPRGRRLCWSLLDPGDYPGWDRVWDGASAGDLTGLTDELAACVARTDLDSLVTHADELTLLAALAEPVETAMYWQEPDDEDLALADQTVRDALLPVSDAVTTAPAASWWSTPAGTARQQYVEWLAPGGGPPSVTGATAELAAWRAALTEEEQAARTRPEDLTPSLSGHWWSTPVPSRLLSTTRSLPGIGAVGLAMVEDGLDWKEAHCWPMKPQAGARIYGISHPVEWTELVARYPIDVTDCRRHDWWRATGWDGHWLIPDFAAVAEDYDAVHVSLAGYLATAGRALRVDDACTILAGWNPDQTYWLTDTLTLAGPATKWAKFGEEPLGWAQCRVGVQPR